MTIASEVRDVARARLSAFAASVGPEGPVCVAGGRTQWAVGGLPAPGTREVAAPSGVVAHQPEEMIVRVRAGTTVAELDAVLAEGGQMVPLDPVDPRLATVGGVLAVGRSGPRRLRYGPVRDAVLEVQFVTAGGELAKAGGPVVKNVTGYDLCRLLVGSLGTLGLLAEVVLRCSPRPAASRWLRSVSPGGADPFSVLASLYRPSSVLWDGQHVWALLEGHPDDVSAQVAVLGPSFSDVAGPPVLPGPGRLSLRPGELRGLPVGSGGSVGGSDGSGGSGGSPGSVVRLGGSGGSEGSVGGLRWLAEVSVGTVHTSDPAGVAAAMGVPWHPVLPPRVVALQQELKQRFDPRGRLNPGRDPSRAAGAASPT